MEQRIGRIARIGSLHDEVHVHLIRPPASAATVLNSEPTVERKWTIARAEENTPRKVEQLREVLEAWRHGSEQPELVEDSAILVGATNSDENGFLAAVTLDSQRQFVIGDARGVTAGLDAQLRVCGLSLGGDADVHQNSVLEAIDSIHCWLMRQRAAAAAGVAASHSLGRSELIARIDSSIESAPPHQRSARLSLADRARKVVTHTQGANVERELETIGHASLPEEEWLAAVANLDTRRAIQSESEREDFHIHAILLLAVKQLRSQPPPDPECP